MRFIDEAKILVRSGKGGNGCVSFRREKYIPKGGPDGGDGGKGGDVYLRASSKLLTLYDFRHKRVHEAQNGQPGMGKQRYGRSGDDLIIDVPVGTLVYEILEEGREKLLVDLVQDGQMFLVAKGGRGGKGNVHFKSSTMRTPRFAQPGEEGEEKTIRLELKIIADVGLVGLPNAGKSTFISRISAARPKIASYPFTTLTPNLGVVEDDFGRRMVVADIPGLIEGAHKGHGLGDRFLKHVERTRFLVHILSVEDVSLDNIFSGFELINNELGKSSPVLAQKEQILVLNKIDLLKDEDLSKIQESLSSYKQKVFLISALTGKGVEQLLKAMWQKFYSQ
jgi:GTP-binding protein